MKLESVALTNIGLVREQNQDAIFEAPDKGLFLVADGMGGEQAGEEASAQVVQTVQSSLSAFFSTPPQSPTAVIECLRDTLLQANMDVLQIAVREPEKRGLGSTASLLCLQRGVYFISHVGDSRVYLCRGGQFRQLTRDHTLVWMLYERDVITREQLETHPERHLLTQCIGSRRPVNVDLLEGPLEVGDVFLICSDGLSGMVSEEDMGQTLLREELGLQEKGDQLIQAALDAGGGDNVSAVLVRITELDEQDNWVPDALNDLANFEVTKEETIASEETRKPVAQTGRSRLWLPVVLLMFILAFVLLNLRDFGSQPTADTATLELKLPDTQVERVEVAAFLEGKTIDSPQVFERADLTGKSLISLQVQPNVWQIVRVRSLGQDDFVTSRLLSIGDTATVEIAFPE